MDKTFHDTDDTLRLTSKCQEIDERYKSLFESSGIGTAIIGIDGSFLDVNRSLCDLFGYSEEQLLAMNFQEVLHKDDDGVGNTFEEKVLRGRMADGRTEKRCVHSKGYSIWISMHSSLVHDKGGPSYYVFQIQDISEQKKVRENLESSEIRYRRLFETAQDGILILDAYGGYIVDVNQFLITMLGYSRDEFLGKRLWEIGPIKDVEASKTAFNDLQDKGFVRYENMPLQTKDGRNIEVEFVSNVYNVNDLKVIQCNIRDITARKNVEKMLRDSEKRFKNMSFHDSLTGLYNRSYFSENIALLDTDLSRFMPVSIFSIDVDDLKMVNDTYGHKEGDELLKSTAKIIASSTRKVDILARLGGDEFCIILLNTDHQAALQKKNELLRLLAEYNAENPPIKINFSIGVATSDELRKESIHDIYHRADEHMYKCKLINKNGINADDVACQLTKS